MLFMKIFATNINKPYTIIETQIRVLGMFRLCLRMWVIKLQINFPLLYSKGMPIKCAIVSPLPPFSQQWFGRYIGQKTFRSIAGECYGSRPLPVQKHMHKRAKIGRPGCKIGLQPTCIQKTSTANFTLKIGVKHVETSRIRRNQSSVDFTPQK